MSADLHKKHQTLARLERHYALEKVRERKRDTRRKIELGGLVIKAKLHDYSKALILGALLDAKTQLLNVDGAERLFSVKGEAAFMNYGEINDE